jgi:methionyl-tRNA formyltransferase
LTPDDLRLQWEQPAAQLHRLVRLGRAWTTFRGKRLGVLRATPVVAPVPAPPPGTLVGTVVCTGDGALALDQVQPESRTPMPAGDWARGVRPLAGERLGSD